MPPLIPGKIRMVGTGGTITCCLIHKVTKYTGYEDTCVRVSFPVLPFRKEIIVQTGLSKELSTSVAGCSPRDDRATDVSSFSMCVMDSGY